MIQTLRMIDASLNRCREGLRVMEDVARFALNAAGVCERLKNLRHALVDAERSLGVDWARLLANRDTPGDVGTAIKTAAEGSRVSLREVTIAAAKRAAEALRSLEESAKTISTPSQLLTSDPNGTPTVSPARRFEMIRYELYDIERELALALGGDSACPQWRLCVLITESLCARPWMHVAREAIRGGADCLQLREKNLDGRELLSRARELVRLAREEGKSLGRRVGVIINDRVDIALLCGADGVHLGQGDLSVADARRLAGGSLLIGVSTHDEHEARRAIDDGADLCGVGAMFSTLTKPRVTSGVAYLRQYLWIAGPNAQGGAGRCVPHLAIGGITPENVGELARAGCMGVAVSSVVCGSDNPRGVCESLLRGLTDGGAHAAGAGGSVSSGHG